MGLASQLFKRRQPDIFHCIFVHLTWQDESIFEFWNTLIVLKTICSLWTPPLPFLMMSRRFIKRIFLPDPLFRTCQLLTTTWIIPIFIPRTMLHRGYYIPTTWKASQLFIDVVNFLCTYVTFALDRVRSKKSKILPHAIDEFLQILRQCFQITPWRWFPYRIISFITDGET